MFCFLTSNCFRENTSKKWEMIPDNHMIEELRLRFPTSCRAVFVCSDPYCEDNDYYLNNTRDALEREDFRFERFIVLDARNADQAEDIVRESNFLLLAGGHVPTQNRFFAEIKLRRLLKGYEGVIIGISAGSMNSADVVYAHPELDGEALDPKYKRFLNGLGLTKTMILPHYDEIKDETLDGLRVIEDIALPDSKGKTFYLISDGAYLFIENGREEMRGEAYMARDGIITRVLSTKTAGGRYGNY
ncbi:MAG: Type 1 glutamine amidotransferase-like domain-containing protein [Firmicutes bacterium]|nr:Type 1 glutamine amidotransferase-like domain-containing protein [Bacillota bacterium]